MDNLKIISETIIMDLKSSVRYKFGLITDIITLSMLLVFFFLSDTGSSFGDTYEVNDVKSLLLMGYILWSMSITTISTLANIMNIEARNGTLPIIFYSKAPIELILLARTISSQILNFIVLAFMILMSNIFFGVNLHFSYEVIVPIIVCMLGIFGLGLAICGLSLYLKKVGSLVLLIQIGMLFITDTIPTSEKIYSISHLLPLTLGNDILRRIASGMNYSSSMTSLLIISFAWLIIGIISLRYFINRSKMAGNLTMY